MFLGGPGRKRTTDTGIFNPLSIEASCGEAYEGRGYFGKKIPAGAGLLVWQRLTTNLQHM